MEGPFRGVGGGGMVLAVMQKHDPAHERNVIDFLQFLTTPESGRLLVEKTLADGQPLTGPLLIEGVELPGDLAEKFAVFKGHGYEKVNYRGLSDEQESVQEWVVIAQEYLRGRLPLGEVLAPVIRCLEEGIEVRDYQAACFSYLEGILRLSELGRHSFLDEKGELLAAGGSFSNRALAGTLRHLGGCDPEEISAWLRKNIEDPILDAFGPSRGGRITARDLESWKPVSYTHLTLPTKA